MWVQRGRVAKDPSSEALTLIESHLPRYPKSVNQHEVATQHRWVRL